MTKRCPYGCGEEVTPEAWAAHIGGMCPKMAHLFTDDPERHAWDDLKEELRVRRT